MNACQKNQSALFIFLAAGALLVPLTLWAQEEGKTSEEPVEKVVAGTKLAIELGAPFRDGAVLQREMKVPVWGWSRPGTTVTVEFAGQKKTATAGTDGKWLVELDPLKASFQPAEMKITESTGKTVTIKDILVGEVWFASGQSNMQLTAAPKTDVGQVLQKQIARRVAAGEEKQPVIREAKITDFFAVLHPIEHANARWHDEAGDMSAIAYSFAYHVFREVNVPIGILNCSFSETSIQAWTPREGFRDGKDEYTQAIYKRILETDPNTPEHKAAWGKYYAEVEAAIQDGKPVPTKVPGNMNGNRDATWLFNARLNPMIPYAVRGGIWNQGYANIHEGLLYYNNLHSLIRGWRLLWNRPDLPVYFNQFYAPGQQNIPSIGSMAEMRLGTWLARDIPHTGMASQIDITGGIHYFNKTLAGQRLALHALKNEYGKNVVADGPMFKSYRVEGDKVMIELENTAGELLVAETGSNVKDGLGMPKVIPNGADQVKLFYVADENRVWFPADVKIAGEKLIVTSPKVKAPRGVSYATGGAGNQPNIYNQALLPLTPFIYYDHELVTSKTWPGGVLKIDGVVMDPNAIGLANEYRKMPLLSSQFVHDAVLQAGQPVTIWGATRKWGQWDDTPAEGKAEIHFSFAGVEKTIPVTPAMREWQVTLPPMPASAEPKTLKVTFTINGELAHERVCTNVVIGDVWYVAAPGGKLDGPAAKTTGVVRMMTRRTKGDDSRQPRRFSVSTSTTPENRYASLWEPATGFAAALGSQLAAKSGRPVGIIFMQSAAPGKKDKNEAGRSLKHWIPAECLDRAPSLRADYEQLASLQPGTKQYEANARRYLAAWKKYWSEYVPALMQTKAVPDGVPWGKYPSLSAGIHTDASQVYNVMVCSFTPASVKGIIFITGPAMVSADQGLYFGEQMTALANCWKEKFACEDPQFLYTMPDQALAPKITAPTGIKGKSMAIKFSDWKDVGKQVAKALDAFP